MQLFNLRRQIDKIDKQIIPLLGQRMDLAKEIGKIKKQAGVPAYDTEREKKLIAGLKNLASENGLSEVLVDKIYKIIFAESKMIQEC